MHAAEPSQIKSLNRSIVELASLWEVPQLESEVSIRISTRFQSSLGSYRPAHGEIALAAWLLDAPDELLEEVLCHEAAHAAVNFVHGASAKPHGSEWRGFMSAAGVPARVRIPASELPRARQSVLAKRRVWEHRCPVCQATRMAATRVTRWRCRRCREAGLSGELVIERVAGPMAVDA